MVQSRRSEGKATKLIVPEMTAKKTALESVLSNVEDCIDELISYNPPEGSSLDLEVKSLITVMRGLAGKVTRLIKLEKAEGKAYKFMCMDTETGEYRPMTKDEVYRTVMGYPKKGMKINELIREVNRQLDERYGLSEKSAEIFREITGARNIDGDWRPADSDKSAEDGTTRTSHLLR